MLAVADEGILASLTVADVLSGISLLVAGGAALKAGRLEKRLQLQSDKRGTFDQWVVNPVEAKLGALEQCALKISTAMMDEPSQAERSKLISKIQASEFDLWFFGFEALCTQQGDDVLQEIYDRLVEFPDGFLEPINESHSAADGADLAGSSRKLIHHTQAFVSCVRGDLQAKRLSIR